MGPGRRRGRGDAGAEQYGLRREGPGAHGAWCRRAGSDANHHAHRSAAIAATGGNGGRAWKLRELDRRLDLRLGRGKDGRSGRWADGRQRPTDRGSYLRGASEHHGVGRDRPKYVRDVRAQPRVTRRPVDRGAGSGASGGRGQAGNAVGGGPRRARQRRIPWRHGSLHRHPRLRRARSDQGAAAAVRAAQAVFLHERFSRLDAHHAGAAERAGGDLADRAGESATEVARGPTAFAE